MTMRTAEQIEQNIRNIRYAMDIISDQIELIRDDYQQNAIDVTGSECDAFTDIQESLEAANEKLNTLLHMEEDILTK